MNGHIFDGMREFFAEARSLTPAMQAQIDQCRRMLADGANPQDMRDLGFAQAAINAAIDAEKEAEQ